MFALPRHAAGILPSSFIGALKNKAPNFLKWSHAVIAEKTATAVWDEGDVVKHTLERIEIAKLRVKQFR